MKPLYLSDTQGLDAALIMFRAAPENKNCSFLFVEGESDEKFWQSRIAEKTCRIVFVVSFQNNNEKKTGKTAVIKNIRSLNKSRIDGFLGVIDHDFDALMCLPRENNICVTDTHDLETLLLSSPDIFRKLLAEFGDSQHIANFEHTTATTVHAYLLELALAFAQIEWLKQQLHPGLELKNLHKNNTVLSPDTWRLELTKLHAIAITQGIDFNLPTSQALLQTIASINPWLLCNGHIMIDILSIGFQKGRLGNNNRATSDNISSYIRGAMDKIELYQTELCSAMLNWQNNHRPYVILTPQP